MRALLPQLASTYDLAGDWHACADPLALTKITGTEYEARRTHTLLE